MKCWEILGVEPSADLKTLRQAYSKLVKACRPETDPEGFQALRDAFEEARQWIEHSSTESNSDKGVSSEQSKKELLEAFLSKVTSLCEDFQLRINPKSWASLLNEDIMWDIELKLSISINIFNIISRYPPLPAPVYQELNRSFNWKEEAPRFSQYFEEQQINYVLSNIVRSAWSLGHEGLGGLNSDQAREFYNARAQGEFALERHQLEAAEKYFLSAIDIAPYQPDLFFLLGHLYVQSGQYPKAEGCFLTLSEISDSSLFADGFKQLAELSYKKGRYLEAIQFYQAANVEIPFEDSPRYADCFFFTKQFLLAKQHYLSRLKHCPYDHYSAMQLNKVNVELSDTYRTQLGTENNKEKFDAIVKLAECQMDLNRYKFSIDLLDSYIPELPDEYKSIAYFLLGKSYMSLNCEEQAVQSYKLSYQAMDGCFVSGINEVNGKDCRILSLEGLADYSINNHFYDDGIHYLNELLTLSPGDEATYFKLGEISHLKNNYENAIIHYSKAIESKCNEPTYLIARGNAYGAISMWREQAEDYKAALKVDFMNGKIWGELGLAYINLEEYDNAKEALSKSVLQNLYLGIMHLRLKEYEQGVDCFSKFITDFPNHTEAYTNRAKAYGYLEQWFEQAQDFERLLELDPDDNYLWSELGDAYFNMGDHTKAREAYSHSIHAFFYLGLMDLRLDDTASSLTNFNQYIEQYPDNDFGYFQRAEVYSRLGRWRERADDLTTYFSLNPEHVGIVEEIGDAYYYAGEYEKAKAAYSQHPSADHLLAKL